MLDIIENSVSTLPVKDGRFMQVAGLHFKYDSSKPGGSRVIRDSIQIVGGADFNPEATYKVCTVSYIARIGGDGYGCFRDPLKAKVVGDEDCEVTLLDYMVKVFEKMME